MTNNKLILSMFADILGMLNADQTKSQYIQTVKEYVELAETTMKAYERKEKNNE